MSMRLTEDPQKVRNDMLYQNSYVSIYVAY